MVVVGPTALQMLVEVVDELFRHFDERNITGETAIIPSRWKDTRRWIADRKAWR
jgi:hypothetical protein